MDNLDSPGYEMPLGKALVFEAGAGHRRHRSARPFDNLGHQLGHRMAVAGNDGAIRQTALSVARATLEGGVRELGAMTADGPVLVIGLKPHVVTLLQRLDLAQSTFQKTEPALRLPLKASDYLRRQVKFTPFPTEPVGWLIEQAGAELFCFSSDYPHPEGGRDPLGRFEASLDGIDEDAKARFYTGNYAEMMGPVLTARS